MTKLQTLISALEHNALRRATEKPHNSSRKPLARLKHSLWVRAHPHIIEQQQEFNIRARRGKWACLLTLDALKEK